MFRFFNQGLQSRALFDLLLKRINVKSTKTNPSKMRKLLCYPSIILILSIFNSCSSDADEVEQQSINAQNQLKTIRIEAISEFPIDYGSEDYFSVTSNSVGVSLLSELTRDVPNHFGENIITQTFTLLPSSNLAIQVKRIDWGWTETGVWRDCGSMTINIYSENELFHTVTKQMGGEEETSTCGDGTFYSFNVIVPE
jgi:hypothetical protein